MLGFRRGPVSGRYMCMCTVCLATMVMVKTATSRKAQEIAVSPWL